MPFSARTQRRTPEIAGLLILLSVFATALCVVEYRQQANAVQHTLEVKNALTIMLSTLQDAETGQRGFMLTGDESFLEPYASGTALAQQQLLAVTELTRDNPAQQDRVRQMGTFVSIKLKELAARIEEFRSTGRPETGGLLKGKAAMDQIRHAIRAMQQEEDRLFSERATSANRFILVSTAMAALTAALAVVAIALWVLQTRAFTANLQLANINLTRTVDQRDLAEAKARQLQKLEAIGQLTGGIAHDFNNILAVIISSLSLVKRRAKTFEDAKPFIDGAVDAAQNGAELTRRLLAFARQQPLAPQTIDVNRMVSDISELIRRTVGESVRLETITAAGAWPIHVDTNQLQNAVVNLAVNARDAMESAGKLTIETSNCHIDDRYSRENHGVPAGQYVMVSVTDTGTGMAPEIASKAFEPFFTTKSVGKGTGLGLSQVHGFVGQSKGYVKIYSEPGQGTAVKMYFPRHFASAADPVVSDKPVVELPRGQSSTVVLVVEDDRRVREVSVALLRDLGYSVIHADGPTTALAKLDSHPSIDLLFTDIVMPEMTGRELSEIALQKRPNLKVLYTTGFTKNAVIHGGILDQGIHFLAKPFTIEDLALKVREVVG